MKHIYYCRYYCKRHRSSCRDRSAWFIKAAAAHIPRLSFGPGIWDSECVHVWLQQGPESLATNKVKTWESHQYLLVQTLVWGHSVLGMSLFFCFLHLESTRQGLSQQPFAITRTSSLVRATRLHLLHFLLCLSETDSCLSEGPSGFLSVVGILFIKMTDCSCCRRRFF